MFLKSIKKEIEIYSKYTQEDGSLGNLSRLYIEECRDKIKRWENENNLILRKRIEREVSEYKDFLVLYIT